MTGQLSMQALQVGILEPQGDMGWEEIYPQVSTGREGNASQQSALLHSESGS